MAFTSVEQGKARPPKDENAPSEYLNPGDQIGHLLLVWPVRYERDTFTKYPRKDDNGNVLPSDAVYCDVVDLSVNGEDGQPGKLMRGCKWTQGRLIRDTKGAVGAQEPMLIQIGKDGDAYTVIEQMHNPASVQWGEWWLNAHPNFRPGQDQPLSIRQQEAQASVSDDPWENQGPPPPQTGVWPPASGPPATPAAPVNATLASLEKSAMDKLREQANRTPPPSTPLPPPPPPVHHADGEPPF